MWPRRCLRRSLHSYITPDISVCDHHQEGPPANPIRWWPNSRTSSGQIAQRRRSNSRVNRNCETTMVNYNGAIIYFTFKQATTTNNGIPQAVISQSVSVNCRSVISQRVSVGWSWSTSCWIWIFILPVNTHGTWLYFSKVLRVPTWHGCRLLETEDTTYNNSDINTHKNTHT